MNVVIGNAIFMIISLLIAGAWLFAVIDVLSWDARAFGMTGRSKGLWVFLVLFVQITAFYFLLVVRPELKSVGAHTSRSS
jgi:hypothetical protein